MAELLFEILSEEMPAGVQKDASEGLLADILNRLETAGISKAALKTQLLWTPRRIAIHVSELPAARPDRTEERKGPKAGAPEQAVQGFLRSAGLSSLDEAENRDGVWFAVKRIPGGPTADLLPGLLIDTMLALRWPKSMRWRDTRLTWVRPIRNLLGIFDGKILAGGLHLGHAVEGGRQPGYATAEEGGDDQNFLAFNSLTYGHRFLAPAAIEVSGFADYAAKLGQAFVALDAEARKALITKGIAEKAGELGLTQIDDPRLLDEVAGLVESPVPLIGAIDQQFLDLPPEVLTTSMRTHQKYFALTGADGRVSHFAVVANVTAADGGAAIVAGNERVLRARLSDARFFWDQDRKTPLLDFAKKLDARVFHAKLGTVADKVERVASLAREIAFVVDADDVQAERAARLAKADLSSGMVGEFPELQGVMGRYYALEQGEPAVIADAIRDHYKPQGPSDAVPTALVSIAVALADKVDTLASFFAIDERPSGSKDPYALRRSALGVIRIIRENRLKLPLNPIFRVAFAQIRKISSVPTFDSTEARQTLLAFCSDRLKVAEKDHGTRHDLIDAVFGLGGQDEFVDLLDRVNALRAFIDEDIGADLLAAFRRASNILKIEEQRDGVRYNQEVHELAGSVEIERALRLGMRDCEAEVSRAVSQHNYLAATRALSELRGLVDAFFENVTVNDPNPELRVNRLRLLNQLREIFLKVADFSVIEG